MGVDEGTLVSFMWKRNDKFYLSETGEVWDDGTVYWDACSTQTCQFERVVDEKGDGMTVKAKYVKLFVQMVPVGDDGLPTDYGTTVASGYLNISQYMADSMFEGEVEDDSEQTEERHEVQVALKPGGCLNLRLYILNTTTGSDDVEEASDSVTPKVEYVDGHVNGTPLLKADRRAEEVQCMSSPRTLSSTFSSSIMTGDSDADGCSAKGPKSIYTIEKDTDVFHLQKKLKKVMKQCEEARARAFSEASVSLQRGIEIDNLKRAKDVLLRRLETTEQQLMTMMKQELAMAIRDTGDAEASTTGMDSVIHTLAETKVALAEKEFESMELQGKLRAREAHIEALTLHLDAIRSKAESENAQKCMEKLSLGKMLGVLEKNPSDQIEGPPIADTSDKQAQGTVVHVCAIAH